MSLLCPLNSLDNIMTVLSGNLLSTSRYLVHPFICFNAFRILRSKAKPIDSQKCTPTRLRMWIQFPLTELELVG